MADPVAQLHAAVRAGNAAAVEAALAAGADPDSVVYPGGIPALLAAGANPNHALEDGVMALHTAARYGHTQCIQALLAGGANPTAVDIRGWSPLRWAVAFMRVEAEAALLEAAPELALLRTKCGELPLELALKRCNFRSFPLARCLLEQGALSPAVEVLAMLEEARQRWQELPPEAVLSLYAPLVARQPLTPAEWARVPSPCPGLRALLPAVLARSEAEAALLVARLPADDRERLRTAALCIKRTERRRRVSLPAELLRPLLLAAVE